MRLALSSAAAPDAPFVELLEAAARRGLAAVELVDAHGNGHGISPGLIGTAAIARAVERAREEGLAIAGFRLLGPPAPVAGTEIRVLERFARALRAPLLVPLEASLDRGVAGMAALREAAVDARPILPAARALEALDVLDGSVPEIDLAWDADPRVGDLGELGSALLSRVGRRLRHVVLRGGGPEATEQEGRGVGSLMVRLAVSGYDGTIALAPSSARYRVIWDAWLGRKGGWGCGSRSEDRTLVTLGGGQ